MPRASKLAAASFDEGLVSNAALRRLPCLLRPGEVAPLFKVSPRTVSNWCRSSLIMHIITPGGHIRIHRDHVLELLGIEEENDDTKN